MIYVAYLKVVIVYCATNTFGTQKSEPTNEKNIYTHMMPNTRMVTYSINYKFTIPKGW